MARSWVYYGKDAILYQYVIYNKYCMDMIYEKYLQRDATVIQRKAHEKVG